MRDFGAQAFRLSRASLETRLVYTGFLVLVSIGLVTMGGMEAIRVGVRPAAIAAHYRGGEIGEEMAFPKTAGALMEVAHFHAFVMAVVFLILAHLFVATGLSSRTKGAWIGLAFMSTAADLAGPWMVRYTAGGFAALLVAAWAGMWASYGALILGALWEMWGVRPAAGQGVKGYQPCPGR
jgi:lysylphosphatidylglycerol synthetase-like protein (DUF2156 family)